MIIIYVIGYSARGKLKSLLRRVVAAGSVVLPFTFGVMVALLVWAELPPLFALIYLCSSVGCRRLHICAGLITFISSSAHPAGWLKHLIAARWLKRT